MYLRQGTNAEMMSFGFRPQDYAHEVSYYWPDTALAFRLFTQVATQWRIGPNGPVGLDYCAIYPLMERMHLSAEEWEWLFADLQVMEDEALATMHEKTD